MIKYTDSEGDYHKECTPFLSDYLCHSNDFFSEFTDKVARIMSITLHRQRQG